MTENPVPVLGIDPSLDGQHVGALIVDGEIVALDFVGQLPIWEYPLVDMKEGITVIEWPHFQGRGHSNLLPVHKAASMLLARLTDAGFCVYTPPPLAIRSQLVGNATASDAQVLAWLRGRGVATGRGTPFTHEQSHNGDAVLAALWGVWRAGADPKEHDINAWREPRT